MFLSTDSPFIAGQPIRFKESINGVYYFRTEPVENGNQVRVLWNSALTGHVVSSFLIEGSEYWWVQIALPTGDSIWQLIQTKGWNN